MKTGYITLVSSLHSNSELSRRIALYTQQLDKSGAVKATSNDFKEFNLLFILIASGGTEEIFLKTVDFVLDSKIPFFLVSSTTDNSLPASMEILSWTKDNQVKTCKGIIHGSPEQIAIEVQEEIKVVAATNFISRSRVGVIGKPSDWLIASEVEYPVVTTRYGMEFEHVTMKDFLGRYAETTSEDENIRFSSELESAFVEYSENNGAFLEAHRLYIAILQVIRSSKLNGITIRCFDLLNKIKNTGCLALSQLNDEGIPAACEGDVPALFSMMAIQSLGIGPSFMANPSRIINNQITFAHCTAPRKLLETFHVTSHFESGIGLAIGGTLPKSPVTIFKVGNRQLSKAIILEGAIESTILSDNLCRTQVNISLNNTEYFLRNPLGNHHLIVPGHNKKLIEKLCKSLEITCL